MRSSCKQAFVGSVLAFTALAVPKSRAQTGPALHNAQIIPASADLSSSVGGGAGAESDQAKSAALAKAVLNPVARLISVPIQNNFDWGGGEMSEGYQYKLNVQPVTVAVTGGASTIAP